MEERLHLNDKIPCKDTFVDNTSSHLLVPGSLFTFSFTQALASVGTVRLLWGVFGRL